MGRNLSETSSIRRQRAREVLSALTVAELRASHEFSIAGVLRWILEPVSYMFVYFVLVAAILNRPEFAFPLFLLCALVPFRFFTGALNGSMSLVQRYSSVVANTSLPPFVLPLVLIVVEGMDMLVALLLFVPMVIYYGTDVWPSILWLPVGLLTLVLLTAGPILLGTLFGLYYPDLRGVAQNLVRATFFVSTGLVAISRVPGRELPRFFRANPLSGVFDTFRAVFLHGNTPDVVDLVYPPLVGLLLLLIAIPLYRARARHLPKEV
jgi:ABC-type polysaccharide/polyol phosphate export permease